MMARCFIINDIDINNRTSRIDPHFFNPIYFETIKEMHKYSKNRGMDFTSLNKLLNGEERSITGGGTPKGTPYVREDEGIKFIRVQNIKNYRIETDDLVYIPKVIHNNNLKRSKLKPLDVLLTITGVTYGFSAIVPIDFGEANMNQHSVKLEINDEVILPEYISCFLNCEFAKIQMDRLVTGGTRPALDYDSIKEIDILYPKSKEKQQIIVEKTLHMVNEAYNRLLKKNIIYSTIDKRISDLLGLKLPDKKAEKSFIADISDSDRFDAIIHSPYYKSFIDILKKYPSKPLGELAELEEKVRPPIQDMYTLIDLRDIEEQTGRYTRKEIMDIDSDKILLQKDKIYVSCLNPTKGKSLLADKDLDGCIVSNEFKSLKIISNEVTPEYLVTILRSKIALIQWEHMVTGSTPSRERIGEKELFETLIPIPKESVQEEFSGKILDDIKKISELDKEFNYYLMGAQETFLNELINISS